jgi:3-dehydroquinate dehydratase-1
MELEFSSFVLAAATADLADEPAARGRADAVEFRMDLATDPLDALAGYDGRLPLVVTNRPTWEGGEADPGVERVDRLRAAVDHEAVAAVDVELAALAGEIEGAVDPEAAAALVEDAAGEAAVVVSTHDFEGTPHRDRLREILAEAAAWGDVAKLAVTAEGPGDVLDLLSVTWRATTRSETVSTMAMGEAGRHSRAVAPLYGSRIGYAPVDPAEATAPGQYDLGTLATLVERLQSGERGRSA